MQPNREETKETDLIKNIIWGLEQLDSGAIRKQLFGAAGLFISLQLDAEPFNSKILHMEYIYGRI